MARPRLDELPPIVAAVPLVVLTALGAGLVTLGSWLWPRVDDALADLGD